MRKITLFTPSFKTVIANDPKQFKSTAYVTKYLDEKVEYLRDGLYQRLII